MMRQTMNHHQIAFNISIEVDVTCEHFHLSSSILLVSPFQNDQMADYTNDNHQDHNANVSSYAEPKGSQLVDTDSEPEGNLASPSTKSLDITDQPLTEATDITPSEPELASASQDLYQTGSNESLNDGAKCQPTSLMGAGFTQSDLSLASLGHSYTYCYGNQEEYIGSGQPYFYSEPTQDLIVMIDSEDQSGTSNNNNRSVDLSDTFNAIPDMGDELNNCGKQRTNRRECNPMGCETERPVIDQCPNPHPLETTEDASSNFSDYPSVSGYVPALCEEAPESHEHSEGTSRQSSSRKKKPFILGPEFEGMKPTYV